MNRPFHYYVVDSYGHPVMLDDKTKTLILGKRVFYEKDEAKRERRRAERAICRISGVIKPLFLKRSGDSLVL